MLLHMMAHAALLMASYMVASSQAQGFDTSMPWPLCGLLNDPSVENCPQYRWGNISHMDFTPTVGISDTFAPRKKEASGYRCDFHRGLDLFTPNGTNIYAVAKGVVYKIEDQGNDGIILWLKHKKNDASNNCTRYGQYFSVYHHMQSTFVGSECVSGTSGTDCDTSGKPACCPTAEVPKGRKIGQSGKGDSNFTHLHFEIRDAPSWDGCSGNWQADAIHPLRVLPYFANTTGTSSVNITSVTGQGAGSTTVVVAVNVTTTRADFNSIEVTMRNAAGAIIGTNQPFNTGSYGAYNVYPNWYNIERANGQWTHKDVKITVPNPTRPTYASFGIPNGCTAGNGCGGQFSCPFCADPDNGAHNCTYDPDVHLDRPCSNDNTTCCFNGWRVDPAVYNRFSTAFTINIAFEKLAKNLTDVVTCVCAKAFAASGSRLASGGWGTCTAGVCNL